jgi:hypothetical protein
VRRQLDKPQSVLPPPGIVSLNGLVSMIDDELPVEVTIEERGESIRGQIYWTQFSQTVEAHAFALLLPDAGARVIVEPGEDVHLRASSSATEWEYSAEAKKLCRFRTATLEDGARAIVTGVLEEKREIEATMSEYRSQKGKIRIEYVLRPIPNEGIRIDSETLLDEIQKLLRFLGWLRGIGAVAVVPAYVYAVNETFSTTSAFLFGVLVVAYSFVRIGFTNIDRRPWFDRPKNPKKPYFGYEDCKPIESPWGP